MKRNPVCRVLVFILAVFFLMGVGVNSANAYDAKDDKVFDFSVKAGHRVDDLQWSIAGTAAGTNPNIISELVWENVKSWNVEGEVSLRLFENLYIRSSIEHASIYSGDNQDSDYGGDNRTLEFSRSNNNSDGGSLFDAKAGIGYRFILESANMALIPLTGYAYHEQNMEITDGFQTIPATGSFAGLNSTYETEWKGPWVGVDVILFGEKWGFESSFEYLFNGDYYAEADWNLRTDFMHPVSFSHEADATGVNFSFDLDYNLTDQWSIEGGVNYLKFEADKGIIKFNLTNGSVPI